MINALPSDPLADDHWMSSAERELFDRARALVPMLAKGEAATNAAGEVPAENIAAFRDAGIMRILQPRRFGGYQGQTRLFSRIVEELAFGCASSAWVYAVFGEHEWLIASFPEQAQIDVWGDNPHAVASSSLVPRASARKVADGYRLSGRFPFSSGCGHAQWVIVGAFCGDEDGARNQRYMLIPIGEAGQLDDWHVLGLQGTGSRSIALDDVFIPEHRTVRFAALMEGTAPGRSLYPDFPAARAPRGMFAVFSQPPVVITLSRRLLATITETLKTRIARAVRKVAESEITQLKLAESATEIELAVQIFRARRNRATEVLLADIAIPREEIIAVRRDVAFAQGLIRAAVARLLQLSSTAHVYDQGPIQPLFRDIETCLTHFVANWDMAMVPYGRLLLDLPPVSMEV